MVPPYAAILLRGMMCYRSFLWLAFVPVLLRCLSPPSSAPYPQDKNDVEAPFGPQCIICRATPAVTQH